MHCLAVAGDIEAAFDLRAGLRVRADLTGVAGALRHVDGVGRDEEMGSAPVPSAVDRFRAVPPAKTPETWRHRFVGRVAAPMSGITITTGISVCYVRYLM